MEKLGNVNILIIIYIKKFQNVEKSAILEIDNFKKSKLLKIWKLKIFIIIKNVKM